MYAGRPISNLNEVAKVLQYQIHKSYIFFYISIAPYLNIYLCMCRMAWKRMDQC